MKKIIAWLLAFLLTGTLVLFCVSFLGRQAVMPSMNEDGAPVSASLLNREQELLNERMDKLADLYGIPAGQMTDLIDRDTLQDLNAQASRWVSSILMTGKPNEGISWDTEQLEQKLAASEVSAEDVQKSTLRMVLPVRQQIIEAGLAKVRERIDLQNVITFLLGVPWAALALCALLAGLIALLESRRIRNSMRYIGAALGAAAIVMIVLAGLYLSAGIGQMIGEASKSLTILYNDVLSHTAVYAAVLTAAMIIGSVLCLAMSRRNAEAA